MLLRRSLLRQKRRNKNGIHAKLFIASLIFSFSMSAQDKGIIYYTLGKDTTIVQHFSFDKGTYQTSFIQLTGGITKCEATGKLDANGDIVEVNSVNYRMGTDGKWELVSKAVNSFTGDSSVYIAKNPQGNIFNRRSFPGQGIVANGMDIASFYTFPYMGFYAPEKIGDTIFHRQLSFNGFRKYIVARIAKDKIKIGSNLMGYLVLSVDNKGRMLRIDGVGSSLNIIASVNRKDTNPQVLEDFAIKKNAGGVNVVRTLRDTASVVLDGKKIEIDYWRPHKRGREIFGNVVPWNRTWRTGANNATQLRSSTPIRIGGNELPPGNYGIWSYPAEDKWELIINKNANAWGTDHDISADIFRVPLKLERLEIPVEIMKISFQKINEKSALMIIEWDTYKASVDFSLNQ